MPLSRGIFRRLGVFPIRDHYYEPLFNPARLRRSLREERLLPGIDVNVEGQLAFLSELRFARELAGFPMNGKGASEFYYNNGTFGPGDAEVLYQVVRTVKPSVLLEIGCGFSTLMAEEAIKKNRQEAPGYDCKHICVEPYENEWLERLGVEVIRERVEDLGPRPFDELKSGDILFIDSSHVIRPQGDVLFEYLEVLPLLASGVLVHVHDIFTPRDYPDEWVIDEVRLWNEQYLLEAFLSCNNSYEILGALNFLAHNYSGELAERCPIFGAQKGLCEPGSLWLRKTG
jgi:predicted O-methyltransferase YrrM